MSDVLHDPGICLEICISSIAIWHLHIENGRPLSLLTLGVIVYIPNPHVRGKARQVKREKESERGKKLKVRGRGGRVRSETATVINHCRPGTHTHTQLWWHALFFSSTPMQRLTHECSGASVKGISYFFVCVCVCVVSVKDDESCIHLKTLPLNERSYKARSTSWLWFQRNHQTVTHTKKEQNNIHKHTLSHTFTHTSSAGCACI